MGDGDQTGFHTGFLVREGGGEHLGDLLNVSMFIY